MTAAGSEDGRLLRSVSKSGNVNRDTLSDWAVWSEVEQSSKQIGSNTSELTTSVGPAPKLLELNPAGIHVAEYLTILPRRRRCSESCRTRSRLRGYG